MRENPDSVTHRVEVTAEAQFIPDQSDEDEARYVFAYRIRISNLGSVPAQLISRHWIITDANRHIQEVRGLGVVGEQPNILPGESYEYSSGASIATPVGTMRGAYQMQAADGTAFEAVVPEFILAMPRTLH